MKTTDPEWITDPPSSFQDKATLLQTKKHLLNSPGRKGMFLRALLKEVQSEYQVGMERARSQDPLLFFKPSYEQSLILNAWLYGISFVCVYSANRIGKTTACLINILLWLFPNNPKWLIFKRYIVGDPVTDAENKDNNNRGQVVQVFPRPDIHFVKLINQTLKKRPRSIPPPNPRESHLHPDNRQVLQWLQTQIPEAYQSVYPLAPWNKGGTIWFGAPDQDHHEQVVLPLWLQYIPDAAKDRIALSEREITMKIVAPNGRTTMWELIGKSYESKDTKWSSGAVDAIMLTEGVTPTVFSEVRMRFKDPGIGSHDFTPYEPANSGAASALAQRLYKRTELMPIPYFVFHKFRIHDAPRQIMSKELQEGRIESYQNSPEGKARLDGEFYSSSLLVLSNINRDNHLLDWSYEEMMERYPTLRLYRGLDPGLDHPTACAWGGLTPHNTWIIYRIFAERGLPIPQRCKKIVELSNNKLAKVKWGKGNQDFYLVETNPNPNSEIICATPTDYHTFKEDEMTGQPYSTNYLTAGLPINESVHIGPEDRAINLDGMLLPNEFRPHPETDQPPGAGVYFLKSGMGVMRFFLQMEEFYWERKRSGDNKGQAKDKIPDHGDDELDAVTYLTSSNFRWTPYQPPARFESDSEPEEALIQASQSLKSRQQGNRSFATVAKQREVIRFGLTETEGEDDFDDFDDQQIENQH